MITLKQQRFFKTLLNNQVTNLELTTFITQYPAEWDSIINNISNLNIIAGSPSTLDLIGNNSVARASLLNSTNVSYLFRNKNTIDNLLSITPLVNTIFNSANVLDVISKDKIALNILASSSKFLELITFNNSLTNKILDSSLVPAIINSTEFTTNFNNYIQTLALNPTTLTKLLNSNDLVNLIRTNPNQINSILKLPNILQVTENYQSFLDRLNDDPVALASLESDKIFFDLDNLDYLSYFISKPNLATTLGNNTSMLNRVFNVDTCNEAFTFNSFKQALSTTSYEFIDKLLSTDTVLYKYTSIGKDFLNSLILNRFEIINNINFVTKLFSDSKFRDITFESIETSKAIRQSNIAMGYCDSISRLATHSALGNSFITNGTSDYANADISVKLPKNKYMLVAYRQTISGTASRVIAGYKHIGDPTTSYTTPNGADRTEFNALISTTTTSGSNPFPNSAFNIPVSWTSNLSSFIDPTRGALEGHMFSRIAVAWTTAGTSTTGLREFKVINMF